MTRVDADKIIDRLVNGCIFNRFDEPGVYAEYQKALMRYNCSLMDKTVDKLLEEDSRNVPAISALVKEYKGLSGESGHGSVTIRNEQYCDVCNDDGFVIITEQAKDIEGKTIEYNKKPVQYQYILYCPFCAVGRSNTYDGSQCKRKSPYKTEPLTKYFDEQAIEQMRAKNANRYDVIREREDIVHESTWYGRDSQ